MTGVEQNYPGLSDGCRQALLEYSKSTRTELLHKCKEMNCTKYSSKSKLQLCELLIQKQLLQEQQQPVIDSIVVYPRNGRTIDLNHGIEFIDLFCGIGGFHQAMNRMSNSKCVFACDIDEKCRDLYEKNYKIRPFGDITKVKIDDIPNFDVLCGGFPCFIEGTQVLTHKGYKKIEVVKLDDKLLTHTGKFQNILNLQRKIYNGDLYELKNKHQPHIITCTEEHPFYVREKSIICENDKNICVYSVPRWKPAKELTKNDYVGMVINTNERIPEFTEIKLDKKEYWYKMGYFVGNGWNDETTNKCENMYDYIFEIFVKYANGKLIPEWVQDAPTEFIQEFINGYMKADGIESKNGCLSLTTVSYDLACGLQRLYLKLGFICSTINERDTYHIQVYINKQQNSSSFIDGDYVWYSPFKISKRMTVGLPVYNFEVENDNSYIVENVIVHNCQSFSNSGKKKGFEDKRGQLFEYILEIAIVRKPSFMFLENVKHIKKIDDGKVFEHIVQRINETGYSVITTELSPHQLGIPQQRERVVFVCIRNDIYDPNKILNLSPSPQIPIEMDKIFETDKAHTDKYRISNDEESILNVWDKMIQLFEVGENLSPTILCNEFNTIYTEAELNILPTWKKDYIVKNRPIYNKYKSEWDTWINENQEIINKRGIYSKLEWQTGKKKENDSIFNHFIQFRQSGIRVKKSEYFPTLVAIVQTPIYAKERRFITPRECARLQSFPDDFIMHDNDHIAYKQFGNAVNVDVVHFVISNTLELYLHP